MLTLLEATKYAFAKGGPVHQSKGQHRPFQEEGAINLAIQIEGLQKGDTPNLWMQQQRAGIGKTLEVMVVVSLFKLLYGKSSMIATYTRAMRQNYLKEKIIADEITNKVLSDLKHGNLYRPMIISEYQSGTAFFSPRKIANLEERILSGAAVMTPEFSNMINYYHSAVNHGRLPSFSEFFLEGGRLPKPPMPLDWCVCSSDRGHELAKEIEANNQDAQDADIVLVTHAMLIRSSISQGRVLNTTLDEDKESPITGLLLVDEADRLPTVAKAALTSGFTYYGLLGLLREIDQQSSASQHGRKAIAVALQNVQPSLDFLGAWITSRTPRDADGRFFAPPPLALTKNDISGLVGDFVSRAKEIDICMKELSNISCGNYHSNDRDLWMADRIRNFREELRALVNHESHSYPIVIPEIFLNLDGQADLHVFIELGAGRHLINQLWRTNQQGDRIHTFSGVAFVSATLTDMPPYGTRYRTFKRDIGFDPAIDTACELPPLPRSSRQKSGNIGEVMVVSRDTAAPTDRAEPSLINPDFVMESSIRLNTIAAIQAGMNAMTRMLILCPSYPLVDAFYAAIQAKDWSSRVIKRERYSNLASDIAKYARTPHGIWIGVEWEGVNFIDPYPGEGEMARTLADIIVFARIPQPPPDPGRIERLAGLFGRDIKDAVKAEQRAQGISLRDGIHLAYQKQIQGIGRGFRNPFDFVQLMVFLDPRFPVPRHVAERRKIMRSGADPNKLYAKFDTVLEPYGVKKWSQIDKAGTVTSI